MILNPVIRSPFQVADEYKLTKYKEMRGHIYLLTHSKYPEFIKVGKAHYLSKRMQEYNENLPVRSVHILAYTKPFVDCNTVEHEILKLVKLRFNSIKWRREWFDIEAKGYLLDLMYDAETHFEVCTPAQRQGLFSLK